MHFKWDHRRGIFLWFPKFRVHAMSTCVAWSKHGKIWQVLFQGNFCGNLISVSELCMQSCCICHGLTRMLNFMKAPLSINYLSECVNQCTKCILKFISTPKNFRKRGCWNEFGVAKSSTFQRTQMVWVEYISLISAAVRANSLKPKASNTLGVYHTWIEFQMTLRSKIIIIN